MKLKNWILVRNVNFLVFILLSPLLLSFLLLMVAGIKDAAWVLGILSTCVLFELGFYMIYTNALAGIIIHHCRQADLSMRPILTASLISGVALITLCLSVTFQADYITTTLVLFTISEFIRFYFIAKIFIKAEKQPLNFWNYLSHIWLLANPLIGIWALHQRVKNFVEQGS